MDERGHTARTGRHFGGQYMALGMCFGLLWGLLLFGSYWFLGVLAGMMIGAYLDSRRAKA